MKITAFRIALVVIIVVAILIIIHAAWTLAQANRTVGDTCACSGVTDMDLYNLKVMSVFMLLIGIGLLIYGVVMILLPMEEKRHIFMEREGITERRTRRSL
uniref:Uncharacterized protein n=1 Tax=viral metagenome TaxID=1070528 RepID=A0A6C0CGM4_9ZZZZ